MVVDGGNNSALDPTTIAALQQSGLAGCNSNKADLDPDPLEILSQMLEAIDTFP